MSKKVLILAGGGGHTGYGYALAQRLYGKALLHFLVPEGDRLSQERLSKFGTVDSLIKPREVKTPMLEFAPKLARSFVESFNKISSECSIVVSTGSNFCIPPAFFAWLKRIPLVNIESSVRFTRASRTARILQPVSTITALQWEEQKRLLNGIAVGPLLSKPEMQSWNGGYILVTGGTFGHRKLFDILLESSLENVVMQTGKVPPEPYMKKHSKWRILAYSTKFYQLLAGAELVVTHFGSTILEALAYRKPIVIVPNPEWTRTAGMEDARCLAKKVNAVLVSELTLSSLLGAIEEARQRALPTLRDGAEALTSLILEL